MKSIASLIFAISAFSCVASAEYGKDEPLLFPAGASSADTLRSGEFELGPPWGGWIAGGIGDHITLGWDYPAALFAGIPAGLVRIGPFSNDSPFKFSLEGYYTNWGSSYIDKRNSNFQLEHQGASWWAHGIFSVRLSERVRLHAYGGTSFANFEQYSPYQGASFPVSTFQQAYSPDYGFTFEWDIASWLKFFANGLYGNSFYFSDQISRKTMAVYSFDLAPFSKGALGILRTFRLELSALWLWMPIAGNYQSSLALPIFPSMYWQFSL